eukprot:s855_g7.t1
MIIAFPSIFGQGPRTERRSISQKRFNESRPSFCRRFPLENSLSFVSTMGLSSEDVSDGMTNHRPVEVPWEEKRIDHGISPANPGRTYHPACPACALSLTQLPETAGQ